MIQPLNMSTEIGTHGYQLTADQVERLQSSQPMMMLTLITMKNQ